MPRRLGRKVAFTKGHIVVLLLLLNSFTWYLLGQLIVAKLTSSYEDSLALFPKVAFPLSIILSALVGSVLFSKAQRNRVLYGWLLFGTVASLLPAVQVGNSFEGTLALVVVLGGSLGLGMPLLLRRFAESLPVENRGTIGGLTFFTVTASAPIIIFLTPELGLLSSALVLALWRCWSIPALLALPAKPNLQVHCEKGISFRDLFSNRAFVLYFIAWLMFSMVDGFEELTISQYGGRYAEMNMIEPIVAGFSALAGGILADRTGRRRVIISGFVSLGIAYAVLGIDPSPDSISWLLYFVVDGFAIGLLWTMFTIVIWGELAARGTEKYYAVGEAPFFLTRIVYLFSTPYFASLESTSTFSLAAFFLFIAVVPLFYAPETLPEKKIHDRQLKIYTEDALRLKQRNQPQ